MHLYNMETSKNDAFGKEDQKWEKIVKGSIYFGISIV